MFPLRAYLNVLQAWVGDILRQSVVSFPLFRLRYRTVKGSAIDSAAEKREQ